MNSISDSRRILKSIYINHGVSHAVIATRNRQRPTFPGSFPPSIIGAKELNFCVRDGNRCDLLAIVTGFFFNLFKKLNKIFLTYYSSYAKAYDKENLLVKCSTY